MNIEEKASKCPVPRRRHRDRGVTGHLSDDEERMDGVREHGIIGLFIWESPRYVSDGACCVDVAAQDGPKLSMRKFRTFEESA